MRAQAAKNDEVIIARYHLMPSKPIIGALRICPVENSWLLRSMSIENSYQRKGIGHFMLSQIQSSLSKKNCYCFPYRHLESFYQKAGFQVIDDKEATDEIRQPYQQYIDNGKDIILMQFRVTNE